MNEQWKDVPGYEGFYQVSNCGRVRSLNRTRTVKDAHGGLMVRADKGKILSPNNNGHGYLLVRLRKGENQKENRYIHRLVAEVFCERPDGCPVVNHIDHNPQNNSADNLEWCTQKENIQCSAGRMRKEHKVGRQSNTGEKYISIHKRRGRMRYRVCIDRLNICKEFPELSDAIAYRDEVISSA